MADTWVSVPLEAAQIQVYSIGFRSLYSAASQQEIHNPATALLKYIKYKEGHFPAAVSRDRVPGH